MKVFVFDYRRFDEEPYFQQCCREFGMDLGYCAGDPTIDNCDLVEGSDFVSVYTTPITAAMLDRYKELGVRMVSTRTIGYDHIDTAHAKEIGMAVSHITYDPEGVAEFTVMDMLMAVRKMKNVMRNTMSNDFTLNGMLAGKLGNMKVGIVGAGKVGTAVLRDLKGFGCELLYSSRHRKEEADRYARYVTFDELLAQCDIVSLHLELNSETKHIMDAGSFSKMRKGSILVNTARGPLVDTQAMIDALDAGTLSYAAVDVIENEFGLYYTDCRNVNLEDHFLGRLRKRPDVLVTHHMAYYYDTAVRDMVRNCLEGMKLFSEGKENPFRLV